MIKVLNLWLFYVVGYVVALSIQEWANKKRGEPFDDPEFLFKDKKIFIIAMIWLFGGLTISLFVPVDFGILFYIGIFFYIVGFVIVVLTFYSFAIHKGLSTKGIHRYSRNPGYVGWSIFYLGLTFMGFSTSIWSILFIAYFVITIFYFHSTVLLEEKFLITKYGEPYQEYVSVTPRYFGFQKKKKLEEPKKEPIEETKEG